MKSVVMLVSNPYRPDPRVKREAEILAQAGYQVTIIAWDRTNEFPEREASGNIRVIRIQSVPSTYGAGLGQLKRIPGFWQHAARLVRTLPTDVLHCHDLDTLPVGWWLQGETGARLVFDAHEDYPALMSLYLPAYAVRLLAGLEAFLIRRANLTITASTVLAEKYRRSGIMPVIPIGNFQRLEPYQAIHESQIQAARAELGCSPDDYIVAYIGGFSRNRLLVPLIEAARLVPDAQVLLWGEGHQKQQVEHAVKEVPNVRYLGWLDSSLVPLYTCLADVIYYALKPDYPGAIFNAPNTLSAAMAAGRPLICNHVGDLGRIVAETGCGVLLDDVTPKTVANAISLLRKPELRKNMGDSGRRAADTKYNHQAVAGQLIAAYQKLLVKS